MELASRHKNSKLLFLSFQHGKSSSTMVFSTGHDDDSTIMPHPKKIMRRGSKELEEALQMGEVVLFSLPEPVLDMSRGNKTPSSLESSNCILQTNTSTCHHHDDDSFRSSAGIHPHFEAHDCGGGERGVIFEKLFPGFHTQAPSFRASTGIHQHLEAQDCGGESMEKQQQLQQQFQACAAGADEHQGFQTQTSSSSSSQRADTTTISATRTRYPSKRSRSSIERAPITRFSDIVGHGAVKLRIDEILLPMALPPILAESILTGIRSLKASILLYGPPGCGKVRASFKKCLLSLVECCCAATLTIFVVPPLLPQTQLAQAIAGTCRVSLFMVVGERLACRSSCTDILGHLASSDVFDKIIGEAQAAFLPVGPSDVLSKFVGESEASIRAMFDKGE
jgi:SpoVK/Ycf46/Vps4 family AAA+-type ATPase